MMFFARVAAWLSQNVTEVSLKNIGSDFINVLIVLENNYWGILGSTLWFLAKESKILLILIICDYNLVFTGEKKESLGNWYHPLCLKCKKCGRQLATGNHAEVNNCTFPYTLYKFRIFFRKAPTTFSLLH